MSILLAVVAFGVVLIPLVIIHEFGHMLACKSVGISVLEFGLGFPPRAVRLFRWGETDFTLNWLPLGGFVMPYGEDFIKPQTDEELELTRKELLEKRGIVAQEQFLKSVSDAKPYEKLWFLFGGPLANFIAAFVLFVIVALTGFIAYRSDVTVIEVEDGSLAAEVLQKDDIITEVNGTAFEISPEFENLLVGQSEPITLTIKRDGETIQVELPLNSEISELTDWVGVGEIQEDAPADIAGLQTNDIIEAVNGESIDNFDQLVEITKAHEDKPMMMTIRRDGEMLEIEVTPKRMKDSVRIGIGLDGLVTFDQIGLTINDENVESYTDRYNIINALEYGVDSFTRAMKLMVEVPGKIARGELSAEEARPVSVVGIAQIGGDIIEERPYQELIVFGALISIALAVTNLLPIPGLDGGRILFVLIEIVRGKPMSPEREGLVHLIGLGFMLSLMVILIINDIVNPLQLP